MEDHSFGIVYQMNEMNTMHNIYRLYIGMEDHSFGIVYQINEINTMHNMYRLYIGMEDHLFGIVYQINEMNTIHNIYRQCAKYGGRGAGPPRLTHETPWKPQKQNLKGVSNFVQKTPKTIIVTNGHLNVFKLTMPSIQNVKHLFTNMFSFLPSGASQSCARMQISHVRQTEEWHHVDTTDQPYWKQLASEE